MIPCCILAIEDDNDRDFMERLYINCNRLIYHEIKQIVGDPWATEDLMQSTVEKLIDKIPMLRTREQKQLISYIVTAARNNAKNYLRDHGKYDLLSFEEQIGFPDSEHDGEEIDQLLIKKDNLDCLARVWPKLDERSRYLLEGRYLMEKTLPELVQELHIKPDSIRMILARARRSAYCLMREESASKI